MSRTAVLLGASGLVGSQCLEILLEKGPYENVHALVRKPLSRDHPRLTQHLVLFDELDKAGGVWSSDAVFCCLGTTIAKAGSQQAFRRVDHDYPVAAAKLAASRGAGVFVLISAVGADALSRIFYNRIKGETERDLQSVNLTSLVILRPSLILGERAERRAGELLAAAALKPLSRLMVGSLRRFRPIHARTIARTMVKMSLQSTPGTTVLESEQIDDLGKE